MTSNDELFRSAIDHYRSGRGNQARGICRTIVADREDHGPAQAMLGLLAHRENDHDTAARHFFLACQAQPDQPLHRVNHGAALLAAQRWEEAVEAMVRATMAFPHNGALWSCLGNAHAGVEAWGKAEAAFARAVEAEPDNPAHSYNRALACERDGRHERAEVHYQTVLAQDPRHGDARNNLGLVMLAQGRGAEAEATFTAAFVAGSHAGAGLNLSRCLAARGETAGAIEIARHVVSAHPEMAEAHHYLGEACDAAGDPAAAAAAYRHALDLDPREQAARAGLFHALHATGDLAGADRLEAQVVAEALMRAHRGKRPHLTPFVAMSCDLTGEQEAALARAAAAALAQDVGPEAAHWHRHGEASRAPGRRIRLGEFQREVQHRWRIRYPSVAKQKTVLPCQNTLISPPLKGIGSPL